MPSRKATREQAPPTIDDDTPTRDELLEALSHLRAESDRVYARWQTANSRGLREAAWQRWTTLHHHLDQMVAGVLELDSHR